METKNSVVIDQIKTLVSKILFFEKKNVFQFRGTRFYSSELSLLPMINGRDAVNVTEMAKQLGITKGAVSQTITRLEKKNVITKEKDPSNKNRLVLFFTPFGQEVSDNYRNLQLLTESKYDRYLSTYSKSEKRAIKRFLSQVEKVVDELTHFKSWDKDKEKK